MPTNVRRLEKNIKARLRAAGAGYLRKRAEWRQPYPLGLRVTSLVLIQAQDWKRLAQTAARYRRDALRDLAAMAAQQKEWALLWRDVETVRRHLKESWLPPGRHPDWSTIRAGIEKMLRENGFTNAKAREKAAAFARASVQDLMQTLDRPLGWWGDELSAAAASRLNALGAADIGDAVSHFNTRYEAAGPLRKPEPQTVRQIATEITGLLRALHMVLRSGTDRAVQASALRTEKRIARLIGPLLDAAAYWARQSVGDNKATAGPRAVATADAIRSALLARSAARLVAWTVGWREGTARLEEWREAARSKPMRSAYRAPPLTPIGDIARKPGRYDGKYVAIEGWVGPVSISHARRKVVSSTSLTDRDGTVLRVGLPHIKVDSGGLVMGSYAQLTGTFAMAHDDFDTPVLVLDRRNLTDDSSRSWLDWLTLRMLAIITPIPHGLCARWSWVPGTDGAGNLLRHGTWAASGHGRSF